MHHMGGLSQFLYIIKRLKSYSVTYFVRIVCCSVCLVHNLEIVLFPMLFLLIHYWQYYYSNVYRLSTAWKLHFLVNYWFRFSVWIASILAIQWSLSLSFVSKSLQNPIRITLRCKKTQQVKIGFYYCFIISQIFTKLLK